MPAILEIKYNTIRPIFRAKYSHHQVKVRFKKSPVTTAAGGHTQ